MRRVGADRLHVHPTEPTRLRDDDGDGRVALERILVGEGVVRPRDDDRGIARGDACRLGLDRHEVAHVVELLEEVETGSRIVERPTGCDAGRPDSRDGLVRCGRVTGESDLALVFGLEQIAPVLRDVGHLGGVDLEGEHAVVVAVPHAAGILGRGRDRIPGRDLVGLEVSSRDALRAERETDVDDVRRGGALVGLVGLDGGDLVLRATVRVELVDLDAVLRGEAGQQLAIVAPGVRQGDRGQVALRLRGIDERLWDAATGRCRARRGCGGRRRRGRRRTGTEHEGDRNDGGQDARERSFGRQVVLHLRGGGTRRGMGTRRTGSPTRYRTSSKA